MTAPAVRDIPPPGAPAHWPHMPWRARRAWLQRNTGPTIEAQRQAHRNQRAQQAYEAAPRNGPRPTTETVRIVLERTAAGRLPLEILTELQMRPGAVARALSIHGHPALYSQFRSLERQEHAAAARHAAGDDGRKRTGEEVLAYVEAVAGTITARQVANDLGMTARAIAGALQRQGRNDLAAAYWARSNADRRARRAGLPPAVDAAVEGRRQAIDEPP